MKPFFFEGEVVYLVKENRLEEHLGEGLKYQSILGLNKDLAYLSQGYTKLLKKMTRRMLVYCLDSNDIQLWHFAVEEVEVPTQKDLNAADFIKKYGKLHQKKASKWLSIDYKKKDKLTITRFSKRSSSNSVKPSLVKYENILESQYYGTPL